MPPPSPFDALSESSQASTVTLPVAFVLIAPPQLAALPRIVEFEIVIGTESEWNSPPPPSPPAEFPTITVLVIVAVL